MNPKIAQTIYAVGTLVSTILGIALLWGGVDAGTADSVNSIIAGLGVLIGVTPATATATVRTTKQINDGTLATDPAVQIVNGLNAMVAAKQAVSDTETKVTQAVTATLGVLPGGAALASEIQAAVAALAGRATALPSSPVST